MFNQYFFKTTVRTLWRKRSFSLLNILGLTIGIAASLLIFLVIRYELSYDDHQSKRDRIYRVVTINKKRSNGEIANTSGTVPIPLAAAMRQDFPSLERVAAVWDMGVAQIYIPQKEQGSEKRFKERSGLFFTAPSLYDIFDFTWLDGNAAGLTEPNTAVITQSLADAFFGSYKEAVGKTIQLWSYRIPLRIVGVFKDLPENTDVQVRLGASYATFLNLNGNNLLNKDQWLSLPGSQQCFVLSAKGHGIQRSQALLPAFVKKYYPEDEYHTVNVTSLAFQPLNEMHLDKRFGTFKGDGLSLEVLWALALIGFFLLLVACINFVNLATAQSVSRAKEIGVRKVLGSDRYQLLRQFMGETAVITFLSLLLACLLAWGTLPYLNQLMQKNLVLDMWQHPVVVLFLIAIGIVVTLLAGFYPALVLSGFNPVAAIKNKISTRTVGGISLRRGLVVFQFVIAQLLVIGTLVVIKQMELFRNQSTGFQKEAIVLIDLPSDSALKVKYPYLKEQLSRAPGVAAASLCMDAPASRGSWYTDIYYENNPDPQPFLVSRQFGDTGYFSTFQVQMAAGRFPYPSDTMRELLVNETLVKKLGLTSPEDMLGKMMAFHGSPRKYPVVGVLKDFNNRPLQEAIVPLVFSADKGQYGTIALRLEPGKVKTAMTQVQKVFTQVYPTYLYDYTFFDEKIGSFYKAEALTALLFKIAAGLAIFISCLGLYGLVSFMAVQKTKEVGIRKVLGASVQNIVYLFSKEFTVLIGIAFVIAAPVGYYFMREWLAGFHYHIQLGWGVFVLAVALSVLIAWLTVGYKAVKAALANPVKSLRAE